MVIIINNKFRMYSKGNTQSVALKNIPVLRQAFVVAGTIVWGGLALAWLFTPWFLLLPAMVGGGLLFAGVSGVCPMVAMLERLPGNRRG